MKAANLPNRRNYRKKKKEKAFYNPCERKVQKGHQNGEK